jgi:hypothetical protein
VSKATWLCGVLAMVASALTGMAETPDFKTKVTDVTVFKDGHALIMARGQAKLEDGWCRTRDVPAPVLGTFWSFVADKECALDFVKAGEVETKEGRPCLTLDEIIQANVGKQATLTEVISKDAPPMAHEGTLMGILEAEAARESVTARPAATRYDEYGRSIAPTMESDTTREKRLASFVMIRTMQGVRMIKRENVAGLTLAAPDTGTTDTKKVREIAMHVVSKDKPATGEREVGIVYLQKGIRWIPEYRVEMLDGSKAKITLQGTIINEMVDLENADLRLVVGVPSFIMKDTLSPLALRDAAPRLSVYFAPPSSGTGATFDNRFLSNAMMSQSAAPVRGGGGEAERGGPDVPMEGQKEDLFLYHKPGVTLKKGERAIVTLLEVTVAYEDVYSWEIPPIPPMEAWRNNINDDQQRQLSLMLSGAKAMHKLRLTNTGTAPWTTGPATIYKGNTPLAQQLMTYTSVKNQVDLPVTIATDLNTKKEEAEKGRQTNVTINDLSYTKVTLQGKLPVTSFKDKPVKMTVTRKTLGVITDTTAGGKIGQTNTLEDVSFDRSNYPWYGWWPWWWHSVNPLSEINWETTIEPGKAVTLEYDWYYHYRR